MKSKIVIGYCTFPSEASAAEICQAMVAERLVACANIFGPMRSLYSWGGRMNDEREFVAILKTRADRCGRVKERMRSLHPYTNPCLVFWPLEDGLPDFMNWVSAQSL